MVQSCQDSDPGPAQSAAVMCPQDHGVPRRVGNIMLLLMLLLLWLRVCFMSVKPWGLLDALIDNGRGDGCYTCVVVWTVVQCGRQMLW